MLIRLALPLIVMCLSAADAAPQCNIKWADSGCSDSKLAAPAGAACQATNEFSCDAGGAYYRGYSYALGDSEFMTGIVATSQNGRIVSFDDVVASAKKDLISDKGRNFGSPQSTMGAQFLTFESANGQKCVHALKMGAVRGGSGYASYVRGNKCAPVGQSISQETINEFLVRLQFR